LKGIDSMSDILKLMLRMTACIFFSVIIGFVLLVSVYLLPTKQMRQNVAVSSEQISEEGSYYQWAKGYKNSQSDTYTDASLYLNAMYPGSGNPVKDAMNNPRLLYGADNNEVSAVLLAHEESGKTEEVQYGRYWHGSLIVLKPLLLLFDLGDIRMFGMIIQTALMFLIISGFVQKGKTKEIIAFFAAVILLNPITMAMGFCFSVEYVLMLVLTAAVVYFHDKLSVGNRYYYFFLMNGIVFVYFNELSFSMIGLGVPLVTYLVFSKETVKCLVKKEILFSLAWGIGYIFMWIGKWLLAWIFTGYNYLGEAIGQAERYTSENATWEEVNPTVLERLMKNINVYMKWPYFLMLLGIIAILALRIVRIKNKDWKGGMCYMFPYLLPMAMPFAIFVVLGNGYSYVHYWFTHRLLAISVFAGICMICQILDNCGKQEIGDRNNESERIKH